MNEQKAIAACVEYAQASREVAVLTREIGFHGEKCFNTHTCGPYTSNYVSHLTMYFKPHEYAGGETPMTLVELEEECPDCYAAYQAIQRRKEARRRLGAIKRKIIRIGKKGVAA